MLNLINYRKLLIGSTCKYEILGLNFMVSKFDIIGFFLSVNQENGTGLFKNTKHNGSKTKGPV